MKPQTWIKTIGILCIIFGANGVFRFLSSFGMMQFDDFFKISSSTVQWIRVLLYFGCFVSVFYLAAGIIYLKKWRYAQAIIASALIVSMLYSALPKLLLDSDTFQHIAYGHGINYISAGIDLVLLAGVLLLSRVYHDSPKEAFQAAVSRRSWRIPASMLMAVLCFLLGGLFLMVAVQFISTIPIKTYVYPLIFGSQFLLAGAIAGFTWPEHGWKTGLWLGGGAFLFYPLGFLLEFVFEGWDSTADLIRDEGLMVLGFFLMILLISCLGCFLGAWWKSRRIQKEEKLSELL
ncbi:MAG: hypothetical protein WA004_20390 [Saprospiraceae bacterium]